MKPTTYQLPEETIELLAKFKKKDKRAKQGIVNDAILNYIKNENNVK